MKAFKLTDENGQTHGQTQWGPGATHSGTGKGAPLCGPGWIHFYDDPLLAVFLNPIHAGFSNPRLWECEVSGEIRNDQGLKFGAQTLTTLREITPVPEVTLEHRVRFAIFCALEVCKERGIHIPNEIALVGFANETFTSFCDPPLTTVDQQSRLIGNATAEIFLEQISLGPGRFVPKRIVLTPELIIRRSSMKDREPEKSKITVG